MSINMYVGYYEDSDSMRNDELQECIRNNVSNTSINYVMINSKDRLKYNDFFRIINSYSDKEDVNVIANLDIYLDSATCHLMERIKEREVYALCRWDKKVDGSVKFCNRPDSQDTWVFRGHVEVNVDFCIGYAGCDNRIAKIFSDVGWKVTNPSKSIKTIHVHNSNIRNYRRGNKNILTVPGPYLTISPSELE